MSEEKKTMTFTSTYSDSPALRQAGLFNSESSGTLHRNVFSDIHVDSQPSLNVTWTLNLEPYVPTKWDKFKERIAKIHHPITKYRLRLVNTDYEGWD